MSIQAVQAAMQKIDRTGNWQFLPVAVFTRSSIGRPTYVFHGRPGNIVLLNQPPRTVDEGFRLYCEAIETACEYMGVSLGQAIRDAMTTSTVLGELGTRFADNGMVLISDALLTTLMLYGPSKVKKVCQGLRADALLALIYILHRCHPDESHDLLMELIRPVASAVYRQTITSAAVALSSQHLPTHVPACSQLEVPKDIGSYSPISAHFPTTTQPVPSLPVGSPATHGSEPTECEDQSVRAGKRRRPRQSEGPSPQVAPEAAHSERGKKRHKAKATVNENIDSSHPTSQAQASAPTCSAA
ncbi:hypothetical protein EYR38_010704 [Pleurotus pulmonarius]|nr:hypothetical protein EYR38_010704 [Pleurotus pulmonarius]